MKKLLFVSITALVLVACGKEADLSLSESIGKSGSITRFAIFQHYMYVLNLNEVQTFDIADKDHPVLVNTLETDYGLETITIYDNSLFIGSTTALYILDINTNPGAPTLLSKSERLFDIGFTGCDPVVVKGNYAYSTIKVVENICGRISAESALVIYDVSDKSNPFVVGTFTLNIPNGLGIKDNYLFVCDEGCDMVMIFDITDPSAIALTPYGFKITDPYDLIIDGQKMIVSAKTDFEIFDLSNIEQIKRLGRISK